MTLTQEQQMRRSELEATALAYSAAGARFLESLKATNQELEEAQDLVCDQLRDGEYSELAGWDGWLAETIADEREWNEEPRDEAVQS